jgi:hypothetical protein
MPTEEDLKDIDIVLFDIPMWVAASIHISGQ